MKETFYDLMAYSKCLGIDVEYELMKHLNEQMNLENPCRELLDGQPNVYNTRPETKPEVEEKKNYKYILIWR